MIVNNHSQPYMALTRYILSAFLMLMLASGLPAAGPGSLDSLLNVLDGVIENRNIYLADKKGQIERKMGERGLLRSEREIYDKNTEIIDLYESFVCDSAKKYIRENLDIAYRLRDRDKMRVSSIRLGLIYSMTGDFLRASDIFSSLPYDSLSSSQKALYGWAQLKYFGNLMLSTDEESLRNSYRSQRIAWRDSLIDMFDQNSDLYRKEVAGRSMERGDYKTALAIYSDVFGNEPPDTHQYAMLAKGLADINGMSGDEESQKEFLALSAITDTRLAVKENESLLSLAELLYKDGDIDRAHKYMRTALEDANFYNSRFKNSMIARVYPIVEMSYLDMLRKQSRRLVAVSWILVGIVLLLMMVAWMLLKQRRALQDSKEELAKLNASLEKTSLKLAEANLIREQYVGYFMNQYSLSIEKLDKFRVGINRLLKVNKTNDAIVMTSRPLEKEIEDLYENFDKAFLNLYPNYVEEFNELLVPEKRFALPQGKLNAQMRIFALIRLGINDMSQIANFLHFTVQTVYNYKSKIRKYTSLSAEEFEKRVKKIGTLSQDLGQE